MKKKKRDKNLNLITIGAAMIGGVILFWFAVAIVIFIVALIIG